MNQNFTSTIQALEDLDTHQYLAICLDDGKVANNGEEACGILLNKPKQNEHATFAYAGEIDFLAGAAISAGDKITVTTSGYFVTADSYDDTPVGIAKYAVTSGSIGEGFFAFPSCVRQTAPNNISVTCAAAAAAATGYNLKDSKTADNGEEFCGMVVSALSSGGTGEICVAGICLGTSDPALATSAGDALTITTSGYIKPGDSGDYIIGKALANIGSNSTGNVWISPNAGAYLSV